MMRSDLVARVKEVKLIFRKYVRLTLTKKKYFFSSFPRNNHILYDEVEE